MSIYKSSGLMSPHQKQARELKEALISYNSVQGTFWCPNTVEKVLLLGINYTLFG